ncbi:MAG TPA: acylphosphatase [Smithellaceae bacterium]|jgi:acylphosphatase|nr:acylphosphatase [Syntrophaceae bacterium]HPL96221.1 acylphosphatase [Smithellaceae bacterium]HPV49042.1 acylphosphatase [Smithellaceae bacterium]
MKRVHVYVSGRVQGVFFRAETQRTATGLKLNGWVRNMDDGRVEAVFEGGRQEIDKMLEWCHQGPPMSHVDHVEVIHEPFTGDQQGFRIVY